MFGEHKISNAWGIRMKIDMVVVLLIVCFCVVTVEFHCMVVISVLLGHSW